MKSLNVLNASVFPKIQKLKLKFCDSLLEITDLTNWTEVDAK